MAYTNHLLFNNIFLKNLHPTDEEIASANYLVHESARDWYRNANFKSPLSLVDSWIRPLLNQQTLDLVETEDQDPNIWYLVAPWERDIPLAICFVVGERQKLDGIEPDGTLPKGQHWMIQAVNKALQMQELNLRWVILTNGDQWRLLDAQALRRYEAFLEIDLEDLLKGKDDSLAAYLFHRIVRLEDSLERDENSNKNKLDTFIEQSTRATEVTEKYLKTSVSDNLNTLNGGDGIMAQLCMGLVHAIDPSGKRAFTDVERDEIYRNATYLLYRLLFIFYAEARNLLPMEREDYRAISLSRLVEDAKAVHLNPGKNIIQQTNLWDQLNTLFSAIQYSDEYMGIPAYNGGLFENTDKTYLDNYKIANQFVAEALVELAYISDPSEGEQAERIDYRDLSVRHLGSLYEGMIEYRLFITEEELLARRDKDGKVRYLKAAQIERKPNDELLQIGKVYFAQSPHERKATGTHYTAEDLVERLVKQTVMRLLNERWQDFEPNLNRWLSEIDETPGYQERRRLQSRLDNELEQFVETQVLSLRVCDPAMGSGHFLVHIAHQTTNFILWVLSRTSWSNPDSNLHADLWRKRIVENCLYGVDINQMAVELAKLSLWLATMQLGQPLSFLDHHLKQGNSLLGASLNEIDTLLKQDDFRKQTAKSIIAESKGQYLLVQQARQIHRKMGEANSLLQKIASQIVTRAEDIHQQELDNEEVEKILAPYKQVGNLIVAQKMGLKASTSELYSLAKVYENCLDLTNEQQKIQTMIDGLTRNLRPFHWWLEFPMVFWNDTIKGFDVFIGNPPFLGGLKISSELGSPFLKYLKSAFEPTSGTADLAAYFFRLAVLLMKEGGFNGMVATNTIAQGDSRETGLLVIIQQGGKIVYADRFVKWGGDANVEVNLISFTTRFHKSRTSILDGRQVTNISSFLDDLPEASPKLLFQNASKSFIGDYIRGTGFIISKSEYVDLTSRSKKNQECLYPYLIGDDVNNNYHQEPNRYIICFHDWSLEQASEYKDLINIIQERVKPKRDQVKQKKDKENWWLYARYRGELRKYIKGKKQVLVRSRVSEYHMLSFFPQGIIYGDATVVFAFDDYYHYSLLQSWIHEVWLRRQASTMRTDIRYTPTDCYQTFPFPQIVSGDHQIDAERAGHAYYEHRQQILWQTKLGLTKTYNRFHDPGHKSKDIQEMRRLHSEMDKVVLACYGWDDIDLQHDFYLNDRKKTRFMPSPAAQREIFTRLIALNQEIAAQEASAGLVPEVQEDGNFDDENEV